MGAETGAAQMNSQDFNTITLAYKKFKNSIKTKECDDPPSYQECILAYVFETELMFLGIGLLAAALEQCDESFHDFFPKNIEVVSKFTKEQIIAACHLVAEARANDIKDNLSRMQEFT
jgi:hypothetical protein